MSYFLSGLGNQMLEVMSKNALWMRVLGSSSIMEPDNRVRFADRISKAADRLRAVDASVVSGGGIGGGGMGGFVSGGGGGRSSRRRRGDGGAGGGAGADDLSKGTQACCELAIECCKGHSSQIIKDIIFNRIVAQEARQQAVLKAATSAASGAVKMEA